MRLPNIYRFFVTVAALSFFACSDDGSGKDVVDVNDQEHEKKIERVADGVCNLPQCTANAEGDSFYVGKSRVVYRCEAGKWLDDEGASFSDTAFVNCFVATFVKESAASVDKLSGCSSKKEGDLAYVQNKLYACTSKEWVPQKTVVVSEADLGECSKNGTYAYVLSKMQSYACKDGHWQGGDDSVDAKPTSSSSEGKSKASSSSKKESSSSSEEPYSSAEPVDDGTPVRGVCIASRSDIESGDSVSYVFYNMGGTPITFSWFFGEKASPIASNDVSPTTTYYGGGNHRAQLVVNEGLPSESDVIVCTGAKIPGVPVKNCKCNADVRSMRVSATFPSSAIWYASECEGGSSFTYDWNLSNPVKSTAFDGDSFKVVIDKAGKYTPILTVTNDDDETMDVTCPVVNAIERQDVSATCEINFGDRYYYSNSINAGADDFIIDMRDIRNANFVTQLPIALTSDYGYSADYTAKCASSGEQYYDGEYIPACYYWGFNENSYVIPKPDVPGRHTYTLSTEGDEICTVRSPVMCGPVNGSISRYDSTKWHVRGVGNYTEGTYLWTFVDSDSNITQSTEMEPKFAYPEMGKVSASLILDEGKASEITLKCSGLDVSGRPILGCECTSELVSDTNDLGVLDEIVYKWTVSGCKDYGAGPLTYIWDDDFAQDEETPSIAMGSFSEVGEYMPIVQVINVDSTVAKVRCDTASVVNIIPEDPVDTTGTVVDSLADED